MTQRTLVLLKPDAVRRGLIGEIIGRIERKAGWTITALELRTLDQDTLEQHYGEHKGKPFYEPLVEFMASGPVVALVVEGERVIEGVRALAGPTDPIAAAPGSIRGDFGTIVRENLIHASDSEESADSGDENLLPRDFPDTRVSQTALATWGDRRNSVALWAYAEPLSGNASHRHVVTTILRRATRARIGVS